MRTGQEDFQRGGFNQTRHTISSRFNRIPTNDLVKSQSTCERMRSCKSSPTSSSAPHYSTSTSRSLTVASPSRAKMMRGAARGEGRTDDVACFRHRIVVLSSSLSVDRESSWRGLRTAKIHHDAIQDPSIKSSSACTVCTVQATSTQRLSTSSSTTSSSSSLIRMGFTKTLLKAGNGIKPQRGQKVTVHCTGYGKNRDLSVPFWSTKDAGQEPFTFAVGRNEVIKGWDESVIDMSLGEVAKIHCTPDYAYGAGGFPAWGIQPNSELIFEIEVLSFK